MKRILALVLALVMLLSFTACGSPSDEEIKQPSNNTIDNNSNSGKNEQPEQPTNSVTAKAAINETVLVDEAGIKITAKSLEECFMGTEIKLLIENNSGKDLMFQTRNSSINGYMIDTYFSTNVADGKKANESITIMSSELSSCGISDIADIEFSFYIVTSDNWETYLETEQIQIKTSIADTYQYTFDDSGEVVYDESGVKIVIKGLNDDAFLGQEIIVYIENNTDKGVTIQTRDVSVNGFMIDGYFSSDVAPGKHAVDAITFLSSELEDNDITTFETVELSFVAYNSKNYDQLFKTDKINLTF